MFAAGPLIFGLVHQDGGLERDACDRERCRARWLLCRTHRRLPMEARPIVSRYDREECPPPSLFDWHTSTGSLPMEAHAAFPAGKRGLRSTSISP
jgi:hypothetical protein